MQYDNAFKSDENKEAAKKAVLTSDSKGVVDIEGLDNKDYATYYIREVKAPEKYDLYPEVVELEVDTDPTATEVQNNLKPDMPLTGSEKMGLGIVAVVALGGAYVLIRKKDVKPNVQ